MTNEQLIAILQASVAPCVLISGAGLLLLIMSNRLSRPIDRIRQLSAQLKERPTRDVVSIQEQIRILYKRCQILQTSITFATCSVIFVSFIILLLFFAFIFRIDIAAFVNFFFIVSLLCLIYSLIYFLFDIRLTLKSLKIEINELGKIV